MARHKSHDDFEADNGLDTLIRAEEIRTDKNLMRRITGRAKERQAAVGRVVAKKPVAAKPRRSGRSKKAGIRNA